MNIVINKVRHLFPSQAYLEWEVTNWETNGFPKSTPVFFIERGEINFTANNNWTLLTPNGITSYHYIDTTPTLLSFYASTHYRVWTKIGNKYIYSEPKTVMHGLTKQEYLRRRKMLYDERLVLEKYNGIKIAILRRRHIGNRCNTCWDINTGMVTNSHCPVCLGTGWQNPYYEPYITWGNRTPIVKAIETNPATTTVEVDYNRMQLLDFPTVYPKDLLVDLISNERYSIESVEQTEMRRNMVHQEVNLSKLATTSAEYKISINLI